MDPNLFLGRADYYNEAYARNGEVEYRLVQGNLVDEWAAHIRGERLLAAFPLDTDNRVRWFAVDFDEHPEALETAQAQIQAFASVGLTTYLERSRSGTGYHVWGFLEDALPALAVRSVLLPLVIKHPSLDKLYPLQTELAEGKVGNSLTLPFFGAVAPPKWRSPLGLGFPGGCGAFLDEDGRVIPMDAFEPELNPTAILRELKPASITKSSTSPKVTLEEDLTRPQNPISGLLKVLSPYGCQWLRSAWARRAELKEPEWYAALGQLSVFEQGREAAHLFSRDYHGYTPQETNAKFDHALQNPPVGCAYIHEHFPEFACKGCPRLAPYRVAEKRLADLVLSTAEPAHRPKLGAAIHRARARARGELPTGISWGIPGVDRVSRLRSGELIVVGGYPSMGKSTLGLQSAYEAAKEGIPAFMFSIETGEIGLEDRLLSLASGVDIRAIKNERFNEPMTAKEYALAEAAAAEVANAPLYVQYSALTPERVLEQVERALLAHGHPLDQPYLVVYDYLQFASVDVGGGSTELDRLNRLVAEFKFLSTIMHNPVLLLSQLQRKTEEDEEPKLHFFKGTGKIDTDANVAAILTGTRVPGAVADRWLTFVKQRDGEAGVKVKLALHQQIGRFKAPPQQAIPENLMEGGDGFL